MSDEKTQSRRGFIIAAGAALAAAYGTMASFMGRFLYPSSTGEPEWTYVSTTARVPDQEALVFRTPGGAIVNIARRAGEGSAQTSADDSDSMMALSSVCPHLGCQVNWEAHNQRFFCPCHNGVFDPSGRAIAGPPADAGQSLLEYPLRIDNGLVFIQVPNEELAKGRGAVIESRQAAVCKTSGSDRRLG